MDVLSPELLAILASYIGVTIVTAIVPAVAAPSIAAVAFLATALLPVTPTVA